MKTYIDTISGETLYIYENRTKTLHDEVYHEVIYALNKDQTIFHRVDGPAYLGKWDNGWINENWYQNHKLHRLDGPAEINNIDFSWHIEGNFIYKKYRSQCKTNFPRVYQKALKEYKLKAFK